MNLKLTCVIFSIFFLLPLSTYALEVPIKEGPSYDYSQIASSVNITAVENHIRFFSSLKIREPGYPGNILAAEYIRNKFIDYGLENVTVQEVPITNCISHGANITLPDGQVINLYPMEPNDVVPSTTPREGVTGPLIYGSDAYIDDFLGPIQGSIVILNWNTGKRWLTAAKLGAKAVIFLPAPEYDRDKWTPGPVPAEAPINFPRFYCGDTEADLLLQNLNKTVKIKARTQWQIVNSYNVIGIVKGTMFNEIIGLSAHYDSHSLVLGLAPGAEEACGISSLLELAKYVKSHPAPYNVLFVAFTGHHQGLEGVARFTMDYLFPAEEAEKRALGQRIRLWSNLDPSTGSDVLYLAVYGGYCGTSSPPFGKDIGTLTDVVRYLSLNAFPQIKAQKPLGKTYNALFDADYNLYGYQTNLVPMVANPLKWHIYDSEFIYAAGIHAFTFTTAYDVRPFQKTPWDTLEFLNLNNFKTQLELIYFLLQHILNFDHEKLETFHESVYLWRNPIGLGPMYLYQLNFSVQEWSNEEAWYRSIHQKVLLRISSLTSFPQGSRDAAFPPDRFFFTNENGSFTGRFVARGGGIAAAISAYVIDNETGNVLYAPDDGTHAYPSFRPHPSGRKFYESFGATAIPILGENAGFLTVFKCGTVVLFDIMDPRVGFGAVWAYSRPVMTYWGVYPYTYSPQMRVDVLNFETHTRTTSFHCHLTGGPDQLTAVMFIPPDQPVEFRIVSTQVGLERYPIALLMNASEDKPLGTGYVVQNGKQLSIQATSLQYAQNLYSLNAQRLKALLDANPTEGTSSAVLWHAESGQLIDAANDALFNGRYAEFWEYAVEAWRKCIDTYLYVRLKLEESTLTVPYFALLLVPFVILVERAIFNFPGNKKVIPYLFLMAIFLLPLWLFHPGFYSAASPLTVVIGVSILILTLPLIIVMVSGALAHMESIRIKSLGRHAEEASKIDVLVSGLFLGVDNMKKRKARTFLATITLIIMVMAFVNFSSLSAKSIPRVGKVEYTSDVSYNGVYMRQNIWGSGDPDLGVPLMEYITAKYGSNATIVPRAWLYHLARNYISGYEILNIGFVSFHNGRSIHPWALLGLTPQETEVSNLDVFLLEGGRWFLPTDKYACILTEMQAETLGIGIEDLPAEVNVGHNMGNFTVVGIIRSNYGLLKDIDYEEITPLNLHINIPVNPLNIHELADDILIVNYDDLMRINYGGTNYPISTHAQIASITLLFKEIEGVANAAKDLSQLFPELLIFYRIEEGIYYNAKGLAIQVMGIESQIMPFILVMLSVLNLMIASVYERRNEIFIFGSLGFSPIHVGAIFLAEAAVYALLSSVIGYVMALITSRIIWTLAPGTIPLNYSSMVVVIALGICTFIVIFSSAYPIRLAIKLVTPSLKRTWELSTTPVQDKWEIPIPFYTNTRGEAEGTIRFLEEFLSPHAYERSPDFSIANLHLEEGEIEGKPYMALILDIKLVPYEAGVSQKTAIQIINEKLRWNYRVYLERTSGSVFDWQKVNFRFIDILRKQLLMWRVLSNEERQKYVKK